MGPRVSGAPLAILGLGVQLAPAQDVREVAAAHGASGYSAGSAVPGGAGPYVAMTHRPDRRSARDRLGPPAQNSSSGEERRR
jgi:hypothetical protein